MPFSLLLLIILILRAVIVKTRIAKRNIAFVIKMGYFALLCVNVQSAKIKRMCKNLAILKIIRLKNNLLCKNFRKLWKRINNYALNRLRKNKLLLSLI